VYLERGEGDGHHKLRLAGQGEAYRHLRTAEQAGGNDVAEPAAAAAAAAAAMKVRHEPLLVDSGSGTAEVDPGTKFTQSVLDGRARQLLAAAAAVPCQKKRGSEEAELAEL
jgi:hypothetical protein